MSNKTPSITRWWRIDAMGLLALALVTGACYAGLIAPTISHQQTYEQIQPQVVQRTEEVQDARASLADLHEYLDQTQADLQDLPLRLKSSSGVNSRLAQLSEMASEVGLEIHQMMPDSVRAGQRYDIVPIVLSGAGDFAQVTRFMQRVHDNYADIAVVGFTLASESTATAQARFDIGLAWYTLPVMGLVEN